MYKKFRKLIVWCLVTCMVLTQTYLTGFAASGVSGQKRLSGIDRYKTAVAISQNGWKTSRYAVLARGDDYADALCAGPLAQKYGAPILLTETEELNSGALAELKRLGVKNVFIVGGLGAVSSSIESALTTAGMKYDRIYGIDRYETSTKIAEKLGTVNKIVLATGSDFPDALSISAIASKLRMPILLTEKDNLPDKVKQYISSKQIAQTYVIGGMGVISTIVESLVPGAVRLGGSDRFETNTKVMENFKKDLNFLNIYVAIGDGPGGDEFADALSGAVLAAKTASPVVLTSKALPGIIENYLKSKVVLGTKVIALGGQAAVAQSVINSIVALVDNIKVKATYDKAGTYGPASGTETVSGNAVISARDVILQNTIIEGDLLLAESIGDGNVTLKGVTVKGATVVRGGGPNSVIMYNFNGQTVTVDVQGGSSVRLIAQGSTSIGPVTMNSYGKLEESGLTGTGFTTVIIPQGVTVTLSGDFVSVNVEAAGANINVENGRINTLNVTESASNAGINIAGTSSVTTLEVSAPVGVTGTGAILKANVNSEGVSIEQMPTTINMAEGVESASIGGRTITGDTTTTSPATGGGGSSTVAVSAINSITGTAKVGVELTAGSLTPAGATVSYQWTICTTVGGTYTSITGATTNKYTPVAGDATKFIKVEATGTGSYTGTVTSVATAAVAAPTAAELANASITTAKGLVSTTFTATEGTDTNLLTNLNAVTGMSATGVTLTLDVTGNANVATDGTITYTGSEVIGNVIVKINKTDGTEQTATLAVTIPAHTPTAAEILADAKTAAHTALTDAFGTYTAANYTTDNWTALNGFKTAGDTAIDAATDLAGVTSAQTTAISGMAAVATIAETLADAKTAAHTALRDAFVSYTEGDYTPENWITLTSFKTDGDTAIDAESDLAGVTAAQTTAINGMDAVKTIVEADTASVAAVKVLVVGAIYTMTQAEVLDENAVKTAIEGVISGLELNGVSTTVTKELYTPAVAGTAEDTDGTNGTYTFTVGLSKGTATDTTGTLTMMITATPQMTGTVTIVGIAKYGDTLTATPTLTNSGTPAYQWNREGIAIDGATETTYTLVEADIKKVITVTVTADDVAGIGSITSVATGPVAKSDGPEPPAAPTVSYLFDTYLVLTINTLYEFSIGGTTWQAKNEFFELTPSTSYTFFVRVAETSTTNASAASPGKTITTRTPLAKVAKPTWNGNVINWVGVDNGTDYVVSFYKNEVQQSAYTIGGTAYDFTFKITDGGAGRYTVRVNAKGIETYMDGPVSALSDPNVTASSNGISEATGTTTITLGGVITGLTAEDIVVKKGTATLVRDTDYTLTGLDSASVGIKFLASTALDNTSVITVEITKTGYAINGGAAIAVANTIPKPIAPAVLTDDDNSNAEVESSVVIMNAGDILNYTLTLTGLVAGKDVSYTVAETSDTDSILTLPVTTTGTMSSTNASAKMSFTVEPNADNEEAKSATFEITFTGSDYQPIATKAVVIYLAAGKVSITSITITEAGGAATVVKGDTLQMSAAITPDNATNKSATWSVTTYLDGTATIDPSTGLLSATGLGTVTVKATANDGSGITGTLNITISKSYLIGDTGQAGGLIFYDKGFYSEGWRYLEAAPADYTSSTVWSNVSSTTLETEIAIGTGQANTAAIIGQSGHSQSAAKICDVYSLYNMNDLKTYSDWFLPSKDELYLIYQNLYQVSLGGFAENRFYWSSSEETDNSAYGLCFTNLYNWYPKDYSSGYVRAVRAF